MTASLVQGDRIVPCSDVLETLWLHSRAGGNVV